LGDSASAGIETETMSGSVCKPGADGRAFFGRGVVDCLGEVWWE
jgi:hypothetical protein